MILVSFGDEADFDVGIIYQRVADDNHDGGNHDDDKDDDHKDDDDCGAPVMMIVTLMMMVVIMLVKLRNWYCVGSAQVMRSSSAFKVTEDIDPYLVIPIIMLVVIMIMNIKSLIAYPLCHWGHLDLIFPSIISLWFLLSSRLKECSSLIICRCPICSLFKVH